VTRAAKKRTHPKRVSPLYLKQRKNPLICEGTEKIRHYIVRQ
jgi:hypothetical protein